MNESDKKLIPFLRELADNIENNKLLPTELQKIGEFFISYNCKKELYSEENNSSEFSRKDLLKFITLGWYIYNCILNGETLD